MIRLDNVTKVYDAPASPQGLIVAADRLTLEIPAGEIFGLVGPNGAGKTTTLKMVVGLLAPTEGRITVSGIDVERAPEHAQCYLGYLADFFSLYDDLKVWEYLDYFARAYKMDRAAIARRVEELIARFGLESKHNAFIAGLSRGMKQRLGIARALLHDPPVLVLDEPAAGLDPKARVELKQLLLELHRAGKTIFITSHVLSDLEELCSYIAIMEKGRLLSVGPLREVMRGLAPARRIRVRLAESGFALAAWLASRANVRDVKAEPAVAEFAFAGSDAELAELARALVGSGAPLCALEEVAETLEKLFSRLSSGEVM